MTVSELLLELTELPADAIVEVVVGNRDEATWHLWNFAAQVTSGAVETTNGFLPKGTQLVMIRGEHAQLGQRSGKKSKRGKS